MALQLYAVLRAQRLQEYAFEVAIRGKADLPFCTAYVRK